MVNFSKSYPFKGARAGYVWCLFWLDSSFVHWSTRSEIPRQLSQRRVKLNCQQRVRLHINWVNTEGTNMYKDFIISRWLSWCGVSLRVGSVDMESLLVLTPRQLSHRWLFKNSKKLANSRKKLTTPKSLLFGLNMFDQWKNQNKKISFKCTFKQYNYCGFPPRPWNTPRQGRWEFGPEHLLMHNMKQTTRCTDKCLFSHTRCNFYEAAVQHGASVVSWPKFNFLVARQC